MHQLLALAMEVLHFKSFQLTLDEGDLIATEELQEFIVTAKLKNEIKKTNVPTGVDEILKRYEAFSVDTRRGKHGKTAQYWMCYIEMIHLYHVFIRSIRNGDLYLYIYCLPKLAAFFFAFHHQNYARWLIIYHDNLLKLHETHPQVFKEFKNGCFSLKRTSKPFSGIPIDLTLEQKVNADAACQRRGIIALTNSISARQCWAQNHSLRTTIISTVFEDNVFFVALYGHPLGYFHRFRDHSARGWR